MIVNDNDVRRPDPRGQRSAGGWTNLHSWIFLAIVALGLIVVGLENRYHYLSPLGLGKAYRIDKFFGSIQEFDPSQGWVVAKLQIGPPQQALSMMEPPGPGSQAVPMNMPGSVAAPGEQIEPGTALPPSLHKEESLAAQPQREAPPAVATPQAARPKEAPEMSKEEKLKNFKKAFPDFGQDEFQLASDDLYPDWKKSVAPTGTWPEFLTVYKDFIQWWNDAGSPPEPGFKLWKEFLAGGKKG
jgi:hypothetical protein